MHQQVNAPAPKNADNGRISDRRLGSIESWIVGGSYIGRGLVPAAALLSLGIEAVRHRLRRSGKRRCTSIDETATQMDGLTGWLRYLERVKGTNEMSKINEEKRDEISASDYALPKQRKEPLHDAADVRNAIARFNQVQGVTDEERDEAWKRIKHAASRFNVEMNESSWRELSHSGKR